MRATICCEFVLLMGAGVPELKAHDGPGLAGGRPTSAATTEQQLVHLLDPSLLVPGAWTAAQHVKGDDFFRDSVKKIREDWGWVQGMYAKATSGTYMTENIRASTKSMRCTASSVAEMGARISVLLNRQLKTPPAFVERYKETFLDVRRRFKAPIVAFIAGISVLPAVFAGPGKMEKLRVASRNLIIFGGGASVVLYPELVMRAAPTVAKSVDAVQVAVSGRISK